MSLAGCEFEDRLFVAIVVGRVERIMVHHSRTGLPGKPTVPAISTQLIWTLTRPTLARLDMRATLPLIL